VILRISKEEKLLLDDFSSLAINVCLHNELRMLDRNESLPGRGFDRSGERGGDGEDSLARQGGGHLFGVHTPR
jgi:hypothetical protein